MVGASVGAATVDAALVELGEGLIGGVTVAVGLKV
jgi:hypothetical protein